MYNLKDMSLSDEIKQKLLPGTKLHLAIRLPEETAPLTVTGEVIWQKASNNDEITTD